MKRVLSGSGATKKPPLSVAVSLENHSHCLLSAYITNNTITSAYIKNGACGLFLNVDFLFALVPEKILNSFRQMV